MSMLKIVEGDEKAESKHDEIMKVYSAASEMLLKMNVPFIILAPIMEEGGVGLLTNMNSDYTQLVLTRAFLTSSVSPTSKREIGVKVSEAQN